MEPSSHGDTTTGNGIARDRPAYVATRYKLAYIWRAESF